jgi:hypothetical protein
MSRIYKTAKGKMVDMDKVKLSNETAIAVGNMKVNARGDLIGNDGQVSMGRNQLMDQVYAVADAPTAGYSPNDPKVANQQQAAEEKSKSKSLHDLANGLIDTNVSEPVVNEESPVVAPPTTPTARGILASSVAKTTVVTQQPLPNLRKPKGPSRI